MNIQQAALIISIIALIMSTTVLIKIHRDEVYTVNTEYPHPFSNTPSNRLYVYVGNESLSTITSRQMLTERGMLVDRGSGNVGIGDGMNDTERAKWRATERQDTEEWRFIRDYKIYGSPELAKLGIGQTISVWQNKSNASDKVEMFGLHPPSQLIILPKGGD